MRVLKVRGVGKVKQSPDLIIINFQIISQDYDYDKVMDDVNRRTVILKNDIVKAGFSKEDLKTTNFSINTEYRYDNGQNVFLGFRGIHGLVLEFDFNQVVLNNLLRILSDSLAKAEYRINFAVKNKREFTNLVLEEAVSDAKNNSKIIASAAGIKLGKILNINYSRKDMIFQSQTFLEDTMVKSTMIDITPADVEAVEEVIIEWEIEDIMY